MQRFCFVATALVAIVVVAATEDADASHEQPWPPTDPVALRNEVQLVEQACQHLLPRDNRMRLKTEFHDASATAAGIAALLRRWHEEPGSIGHCVRELVAAQQRASSGEGGDL